MPRSGHDHRTQRHADHATFNPTIKSGVGAGTSYHENSHFTGSLDPAVDPKVAFDKTRCS